MVVPVGSAATQGYARGRFFTPPNLLTLSRPFLGGAVWLVRGNPGAMFGLMAVAGVTDVLDGYLARREARRSGSPLLKSPGVWLDPLCDKLWIAAVLGAIAADIRPAWPYLVAILTREILLAPLVTAYRLVPSLRRRRRYDYQTATIGKVTTVAQFLSATALVFRSPFAPVLAVAAGVAGLLAVVHYTRRPPITQGAVESRAARPPDGDERRVGGLS